MFGDHPHPVNSDVPAFANLAKKENMRMKEKTETNNPNVSLYNGNNCNALLPLRCFTGSGGALSATFQP